MLKAWYTKGGAGLVHSTKDYLWHERDPICRCVAIGKVSSLADHHRLDVGGSLHRAHLVKRYILCQGGNTEVTVADLQTPAGQSSARVFSSCNAVSFLGFAAKRTHYTAAV